MRPKNWRSFLADESPLTDFGIGCFNRRIMIKPSLANSLRALGWTAAVLAVFGTLLALLGNRRSGADAHYVYQTVGDQSLVLSVYRPRDWAASDHRPCVIWFFGGGFESGAPAQFEESARRLAQRGLVAITADYRVRMRHGAHVTPADALADARAALAWIVAQAGGQGIDPGKVAAGGGSSGAYLALACATFAETRASIPAALILYNPLVNFDIPYVRQKVDPADLDTLLAISPFQHLVAPLPPTLVLHGEGDSIIPVASVTQFVEKARACGSLGIEFEVLPAKGHEFHLHGFNGNRDFEKTFQRTERFLSDLGWLDDGNVR